MPAVPAWLEMCGARGFGTEVEVEVELPDRVMLAPPYRPPNRGFVFSQSRGIRVWICFVAVAK
jgi:hypothetical protein